jgi:hypothetical protein
MSKNAQPYIGEEAMQNRKLKLPLLAVLALALAPLSFGQFLSKPHPSHRALGYYDAETGAFQPLPSTDAESLPVTATTGTLVFKITINVKSAIPKNAVIGCDVSASVFDNTSGLSVDEVGSAIATLTSGTTYSCTVKLPYSWQLSSAANDKVALDFSTSIDYGYQVTATNGSATLVQPASARLTRHNLVPINVPLSGATTTETVSTTM